jgi:hypothetical protein
VGSTTVGLSYGQEQKSVTCTLFIGVHVHGSDKESVLTHGRAWTAEKVCVHDTPESSNINTPSHSCRKELAARSMGLKVRLSNEMGEPPPSGLPEMLSL